MDNLRLSCLPVSLYSQVYSGEISITKWSEMAKDMGLTSIDINALFMKGMSLKEIEAIRETLALPVFMVSTYSDFTISDPRRRAEEVELAKENIRKVGAIGGKAIRLTAGQAYPDCNVHHTLDQIYDCFEQCVVEAEKNNVRILLENHSKPGAWEYPDYNFHPTRVLRIWEKLSSLPIGVNFDVANAYALEDWTHILHAMRPRIESVHINDLACADPLHFCVVGEGVVCIEDMMRILYSFGFDGWLSIEEAGFQGVDGMKRAIANTLKIVENAKATAYKGNLSASV